MKIFVKAKPNAKQEKIDPPSPRLWRAKEGDESDEKEWFTVWVKEPPVRGRANTAIIELLSKHLKVPKSSIRLTSGHSSRSKIFEIL